MLILLPPSETKRADGTGDSWFPGAVRYPELDGIRQTLIADVAALCADPAVAARALKLGPKLVHEVQLNTVLDSAPTMPAIERYTGVLFDGLDVASLPAASIAWLGSHVLVQTALLGPIGALDPLPNYRLSATASVPPVTLKKRWAVAGAAALATETEFILDLRSEAYVALAPLHGGRSAYLRVVAEVPAPGGESARALNHFNKKTKGLLLRALALDSPELDSAEDFLAWCAAHGLAAEPGDSGELRLAQLGAPA